MDADKELRRAGWRLMRSAVKPPPDEYGKIIAANLSPADVPGEQASEWELGKNQCAASVPAGPRG